VDAVLIAVLIVQLLQLHASAMWRWLSHPVARALGTLSYSLYLYHQLVLGLARRVAGDSPLSGLALGLAASLAIAAGSYFVIERPFLRLKDTLRRPRVETGEAPVSGWADAPEAPQSATPTSTRLS